MSGPPVSPDVVWQQGEVPRAERWRAACVHGATVWLTGLPGSGKSTVANALLGALTLNDLGRISIRTAVPLFVDEYRRNRITGSFILVDEGTFETVGAGMVLGAPGA